MAPLPAAPSAAPSAHPQPAPALPTTPIYLASISCAGAGVLLPVLGLIALACFARARSPLPRLPSVLTMVSLILISSGCAIITFIPLTAVMCVVRLWLIQIGVAVYLLSQLYTSIRSWYLYSYMQVSALLPSHRRASALDVSKTMAWKSHEERILLVGSALTAGHVAVLCFWTFFEPVSPSASGDACVSSGEVAEIISLVHFLALNALWIIMALLARKLPQELNESSFLAAPFAGLLGAAAITVAHLVPPILNADNFGNDSIALAECVGALMLAIVSTELIVWPKLGSTPLNEDEKPIASKSRRSTVNSALTVSSGPAFEEVWEVKGNDTEEDVV